jgi:hypothetical protein
LKGQLWGHEVDDSREETTRKRTASSLLSLNTLRL